MRKVAPSVTPKGRGCTTDLQIEMHVNDQKRHQGRDGPEMKGNKRH